MSGNRFTTTSRQSWGSRLGKSIGGVLIGILLFLVAFPVLFWNESRAVNRSRALKEGRSAVVELKQVDSVDAATDGNLVWLTGQAVTEETLQDGEFGVAVNAIRLDRKVEMYQWIEEKEEQTKTNVGGSTETVTTYHYKEAWKDSPVDSGRFAQPAGHENPPMPLTRRQWTAQRVTVGAFGLSPSLVGQMGGAEPLAFEASWLPEAKQNEWIVADGGLYRPLGGAAAIVAEQPAGSDAASPDPAPAAGNTGAPAGEEADDPLSFSVDTFSVDTLAPLEEPAAPAPEGDAPAATAVEPASAAATPPLAPKRGVPAAPQVGDVRVRFEVIRPQAVSVIAQQSGSGLRAYQPKNSSSTLELLEMGNVSADAMFTRAEQANAMFTWILRLVGFVMMAAGIGMVLAPIGVLADVIPIFGQIARMGTGLAAIAIAGVLSLVTIAIAWVVVRPLLGLTLLALAVAVLVGAIWMAKGRAKPKTE